MLDRDVHDEIMRLRDQAHSARGTLAAHTHSIADLSEWRRTTDRTLAHLSLEVESMVKADDVAEAVAARVNRDHTLRLSLLTKVCATVVGASTFAAAVKVLIGA